MITHSDNTAAVWCEKLAGGGATINEWLNTNGFKFTRVNARTPGREKDNKEFGWGQTTPREMANLFGMIRAGENSFRCRERKNVPDFNSCFLG